ncbi:A24 family peptidase [Endozoicomonas sp. GU-1]|uniref:A24 family peptidase n=2 Tax=Endozoicomonas sp. GU-1 TaxID=3009078 RepID=UPI0022B3AADA|nr:prepilin peptidase [Endozoicomonas sp. GU-1]WBA87419.1 prepilin peptidase [Endozoicomonas sp. GU-1]
MQVTDYPQALILMLCSTLLLACYFDSRYNRIPNWLNGTVIFLAIAFHTITDSTIGLIFSTLGTLTGFACFFPGYLFNKAMGAGDVKLMTALGGILGSQAIFVSALFTLIAGGILALFYIALKGQLLPTMQRYWLSTRLMTYLSPADGEVTTGKFPYALAITTGVILQFYYQTLV